MTPPLQSIACSRDVHLYHCLLCCWCSLGCKGQGLLVQDRMLSLVCVYFIQMLSVIIHFCLQIKCHENVKKCEYGHQVREVEHGVFTPHVFTSTGSMGREATTFYKCLADLTTHWGQPYSTTIHCLRCCMSFALLCSAILHIRCRSSIHNPVVGPPDLSVVLAESQLTS